MAAIRCMGGVLWLGFSVYIYIYIHIFSTWQAVCWFPLFVYWAGFLCIPSSPSLSRWVWFFVRCTYSLSACNGPACTWSSPRICSWLVGIGTVYLPFGFLPLLDGGPITSINTNTEGRCLLAVPYYSSNRYILFKRLLLLFQHFISCPLFFQYKISRLTLSFLYLLYIFVSPFSVGWRFYILSFIFLVGWRNDFILLLDWIQERGRWMERGYQVVACKLECYISVWESAHKSFRFIREGDNRRPNSLFYFFAIITLSI